RNECGSCAAQQNSGSSDGTGQRRAIKSPHAAAESTAQRHAINRGEAMRTIRLPLLWIVLCGGVIMGVSLGARHVQGLFLLPMTADRGWSREAFGFALAMQNLVWGLAQPFTGMIADRFGSVRVLLGGLLLYAAGLCLMSLSDSPAAFTLSAGLFVGIALSATSFAVVYG